MRRFDPTHERELLTGEFGYEFELAADFEQAKTVGGLGSSAHAFLAMAIRCLIHGLAEPASRLLKQVERWVTVALVEREIPQRLLQDERFVVDGETALRYQTLALCNWLLHDQHDAESFRQFVEYEDRFLAASAAGRDKRNISLLLPTYVDARAYRRAIELFASTPGLSVPKSVDSVRNEAQMSYAICTRRLDQNYAEIEIAAGLRKFLDRNVDEWLSNGHFVRAAEWMKLAYWDGCGAEVSATDSLLKCYDHLPGYSR